MSILRPAYRLTIGGQRIDSAGAPLASTVTAIEVRLGLDPMAADQTVIHAGQVGDFAPEVGDDAVIELGYADEGQTLAQVMRGSVTEVGSGTLAERVVCLNAAAELARRFTDEAFRDKRAEDIVRQLATDAGVQVERTGSSAVLSYYVIDGRKSVLRHMTDLAQLTGFDLYFTHEDKLVFEPFGAGREVLPLAWATDILDYRADRRPAAFGAVEAFGEGPGAGGDRWSWLTKDFGPRKGSAGRGDPILLLERSALRSADAARGAARAAQTRLERAELSGRLQILGRPSLRLGDAIRLSNMPDEDLNDTFQVRALRHRLSKRQGFTTEIGFRSIGGAP